MYKIEYYFSVKMNYKYRHQSQKQNVESKKLQNNT